jgi:hypothetical protein
MRGLLALHDATILADQRSERKARSAKNRCGCVPRRAQAGVVAGRPSRARRRSHKLGR